MESELNVPVIDETGLKGKFDWELHWDAKDPKSLLQAVHEQLGLELTSGKRQIEMIVVEKK